MRVRGGRRQLRDTGRNGFLFRLLFLAVWFGVGIVLGQAMASRVSFTVSGELDRYLRSYFSLGSSARSISAGTMLSAAVVYFRYPLLAFLLGFASAGVVLLPALSCAYGFFLSFSVSCFTAAFGSDGVLLALCVFGLRCLVTLPCYFVLAVPSFRNALALAAVSLGKGRREAPIVYGSAWWLRLCAVTGVLLAGVLCEGWVSPWLLDLIRSRIVSL